MYCPNCKQVVPTRGELVCPLCGGPVEPRGSNEDGSMTDAERLEWESGGE